jgi:hypothetical protein
MDAAEIEKARNSKAYQATKAQLSSRKWRMENLYWIKDKDGSEMPFTRNDAQRAYVPNGWYRDVIVKARQLGFSTEIAMELTDDLIFQPGITAAIVDYKLPDAEKKLEKIKFAYEKLPLAIRQQVRTVKDNDAELTFTNGSKITVGTSFRGDTVQRLHISEYGKTSTENPKTATEVKTGAIQAVGLNGKIWVESTAHGRSGEFFNLVERAEKRALSKQPLTNLDFRLHFYGWHIDRGYRLQANLVTVPKEVIDYFADLRSTHGLVVDAQQVAFYASKLDELGPDEIKSEYPSIMEECFFNSLEGAYFKRQMSQARQEKRIGYPVPYDPTRPVNTMCDIGMDDEQAIWFHQSDGVRHRLIDYQVSSGEGIDGFVRAIDEKRQKRGFIYGKHWGPHDLNTRDWSVKGAKPRKEIAKEFGINFIVVPRVKFKMDAIDAARRFLATCFIDSTYCEEGTKALDNYRKSWNKTLGQWGDQPVHDWASHGADALMTGAMGFAPDRVPGNSSNKQPESGGSSWAA